jgi:hypothetical protein
MQQTRAPVAAARAAPLSRASAVGARAALSGTASSRALMRRAAPPAAAPPPPTAGRRSSSAAVVVGVPTRTGSRRAVAVSRRAPRPSGSAPRR